MGLENIYVKNAVEEFEIEHNGEVYKFKKKPLTWVMKNKIIGACTSFTQQGVAKFDYYKYMNDTLCEILVDAPWGTKTETINLLPITPEFGAKLEVHVEKPFDMNGGNDFFVKESGDT